MQGVARSFWPWAFRASPAAVLVAIAAAGYASHPRSAWAPPLARAITDVALCHVSMARRRRWAWSINAAQVNLAALRGQSCL